MRCETPGKEPTFGYLSILETIEYGYFGGYLILCPMGRPLEFHCTAPVRPNRAQEILYGPTLKPYLLGEQIGGALLRAAKLTPQLVITDQRTTLYLRQHSAVPIVHIAAAEEHGAATAANGTQKGGASSEPESITDSSSILPALAASGVVFELPNGFESDRDTVTELLRQLAQRVELIEPFGRIREAIREAQRLGGRVAEAHGQAA